MAHDPDLTELRKLHADTMADKARLRAARDGLRVNLEKLNDPLARQRLTSDYRNQAARDYRRTATDRWRAVGSRLALVREKVQAFKPEAIRNRFTSRALLVPTPTPADLGTYITAAEKFIAGQNARIENYLARADLRDELRDLSLQELVQEAKTTAATSRDPAAVEAAAARLALIRRAVRSHQGVKSDAHQGVKSDAGVNLKHAGVTPEEMLRFAQNQIDQAIETLPLPDQDAEVLRLVSEIDAAAAAGASAFREIADVNYNDISDKVEAVTRDGAETYISGIRERNQEHAQAVSDAADKLTTDAVLAELKAEMQQNREGVSNGN